jgi:hypothetical protein
MATLKREIEAFVSEKKRRDRRACQKGADSAAAHSRSSS